MAEPVLLPLPYGTKPVRDISQGPGGEVTIFVPYSDHNWNSKILKLQIDLTTRVSALSIRVPFLAEMLGAIRFFV